MLFSDGIASRAGKKINLADERSGLGWNKREGISHLSLT